MCTYFHHSLDSSFVLSSFGKKHTFLPNQTEPKQRNNQQNKYTYLSLPPWPLSPNGILTLFVLSLGLRWRMLELCLLQGNGCSRVLGLLDAGT